MKTIIKLILNISFPLQLCAQSLSPSAVSSAGGYFVTPSVSLSSTVAEMTMVQTFTSTGNILTQGFQQPEDFLVDLNDGVDNSSTILIYPNPTDGQYSISYIAVQSGKNNIQLYNLVGQIVSMCIVESVQGENRVNMDIRSLNQGVYLLMIDLKDDKGKDRTAYCKVSLLY